MPKDIKYGADVRASMLRGVRKLGHAVCETLGPKGKNVIIDRSFGAPTVTKDGVTVAREVSLPDRAEQMGVELVRQAAMKTNDRVGDGTTTATAIAVSLIEDAARAFDASGSKPDVHAVRAGMNAFRDKVLEKLDGMKVEVDDRLLERVATISANNDEATGKLVADLVKKVGRDGSVAIEESRGLTVETEFTEGMEVDRGYISPYMVTHPDKMEAILADVPVLVTDRKINAIQDILPLLTQITQDGGTQLVIVADDVAHDALANLVFNKMQGKFLSLAIKAPGYGEHRKEALRDLATVLDARFISEEVGIQLKEVNVDMLGRAGRVIASRDNTIFADGQGAKDDIEKRIKEVKKSMKDADSEFDRERARERLSRLTGGVAMVKVGAATEAELKERKYLIEDAVHACRAALAEGVIPGGGVSLVRAANEAFAECTFEEGTPELAGAQMLRSALKEPLARILLNAGEDHKTSKALNDFAHEHALGGYDAKNGVMVEDMVKAGIVDPLLVAREAVTNAVSAASSFITSSCLMTELPEEEKEPKKVNL